MHEATPVRAVFIASPGTVASEGPSKQKRSGPKVKAYEEEQQLFVVGRAQQSFRSDILTWGTGR